MTAWYLNFRLKFEKDQEENLLLTIIPKHIATQVKESIWSYIKSHQTDQKSIKRKEKAMFK